MKTVLLVDDEASDRATIRQILHADGYTVLEADSYQGAWAKFEANQDVVELLIADISLPDGNGCELGLAIHNHKPDIRVLFVSGHVGAEVCRFFGLDVTDVHYLRKPFTATQLARSVRRVLASLDRFPRLYKKKTLTSGVAG